MTVTKKLIGRLPILLGEYDSTKIYSKRQRVTFYGSEFESKVDNNSIAPATLNNGNLTINTNNWIIVSNGTEAFLAGEKVKHFNEEDNPEFVSVDSDSEGKLLESTDIKGKKTIYGDLEVKGNFDNKYFDKHIENAIVNKVDKETGKSLIDENVADSLILEDNPEYLDSKIDKDGKIITNRTNDGVLHENVGIKTPDLEVSNLRIKGKSLNAVLSSDTFIENTASRLNSIGFGRDHTDFSSFTSLHVPIPQCAYANITGNLPTVKGNTTKGTLDFYDMQGNYFKKYVEIDIHGRTSAVFSKKNYTLDFYNDSDYSDSFNLKFGDWVEMDSYYFQGWYTDSFRGIDVIGYQLWQEMIATRGVLKDRPYKYSLYKDITSTSDSNNAVDVNLTSNALTTPMAFPVILYNNGDFLGIYTVMLKKNRANFLMRKKDYNAVMLDLDNGDIVNGKENWTSFEIRNPKTLICMDGSKYDGDNPKELIDSNSDKYDSSNKDIENTLVTKNVIKGLANAYKEISTAITNGNTDTEIKTLIESHYNVDYVIDYVIFSNVIQNLDGWGGNWQWTTWDGKIWNPNPYDLNSSFGLSPYGNTCDAPTATLTNAGPTAFISKYYVTELDNRYKELVDDNILTASHIQHLFKAWVDRIGSENFDKEFNKWPNTPSQRDSQLNDEYWKRITSNIINTPWSSATTYKKDSLVGYPSYGGNVYKSLVDDNLGNEPNNSDLWVNVTYDNEKSYTVGDTAYVVFNGRMGFECIKSAQGINPLKSIYNDAYGMFGWHDSLPRIYKWLEEKLSLMNKTFKYTK